MLRSFLTLAPFLIASAAAAGANDWTQPCTNGTCYYDLNANGTSGPSGTVKLWGPSEMLSDITTSAGWQILGCSPNATSQDIRLVCMNETASCEHLYQSGAENTVVRLPENCGQNPFARVAKEWVHENQTIPDSIKRNLTRRDGTLPQVKGLSLDTDWASMNSTRQGILSLAFQAASFPGAAGPIDTSNSGPQRRSRLGKRLFGIGDFNKNSQTQPTPITFNKDFNLGSSSVSCDGFSASFSADIDTNFNASVSFGVIAKGSVLPPSLDEFALFADLDATIDGKLNLQASASGTLDTGSIELFELGLPGLDIPGIFSLGPQFKVNGEVMANAEIDVNLNVDLSYKMSDAKIFFPSPPSGSQNGGTFAPQDSPLRLSVSPDVQAQATVTAHLIPTVDFGLTALGGIASATVFLDLDASATLNMQLDASANISVSASGNSSTSTVPAISTGSISFINKTALETGTATIDSTSLASSANVTATASSRSESASSRNGNAASVASTAASSTATHSSLVNSTATDSFPVSSTVPTSVGSIKGVATSSAPPTTVTPVEFKRDLGPRDVNTTVTGNVSGCISIDGGLSVNAGAEGSFFSLFNKSTQVSLFQKNFELFKKCFGAATSSSKRAILVSPHSRRVDRTRRLPGFSPTRRQSSILAKRFNLKCPGSAPPKAVGVADQTVSGSSEQTV